jgi:hypothetical protein
MTQFGISGVGTVSLTDFWPAWQAINQERPLVAYYEAARDFWRDYDTKLTLSKEKVTDLRRDMELYTNWSTLDRLGRPKPEAASTAFYERIDAGTNSMQAWLNAGTATVRDGFNALITRLPEDIRVVDLHRQTLLTQDKVIGDPLGRGPIAGFNTTKIVEGDGEVKVPLLSADPVRQAVEDTVRRHNELMVLFRQLVVDLNRLPDNVTWAGPTTVTAAGAPPGTGPGGGPATGGPGGGPGGGGPAAANAETPGGPGAAPGAGPDPAAAQEAMPTSGADPSAAGPGADQTSAAQTGADAPGGDLPGGPAVDPVTGEPISTLPASDPALAGTPSATLSPTTPLTQTTPLSSNVPNIPAGMPAPTGNSGAGPTISPFPLTPNGVSPGGPLARRDGTGQPSAGSSTVDGQRGMSVTEESPVRSRGGAAGPTTGGGFYPGVVPPMVPPMGGMGGRNGIKPGEADFASGSVRQAGGRDSWRAGLRPQLLGRSGEPDDEPYQLPPVQPGSGGEVLDEELWQVPDAAPAAPPEPPRRGRSWGPG